MKGFARGIRTGKRVEQGQIIGYVGTTGRSTGPHLHYEVLNGGKQVNPLRIKMPTGRSLEGKALAKFLEFRDKQDVFLAKLRDKGTEVAASGTD